MELMSIEAGMDLKWEIDQVMYSPETEELRVQTTAGSALSG